PTTIRGSLLGSDEAAAIVAQAVKRVKASISVTLARRVRALNCETNNSHNLQCDLINPSPSLRSRRKHKAWGASPRTENKKAIEPVKRATALPPALQARIVFLLLPGAYAPGFTLPPASQARRRMP